MFYVFYRRFSALRSTSWSMCYTDENIEDKLQRIVSGLSCCIDYFGFIAYTRMTIATCKIAHVNRPVNFTFFKSHSVKWIAWSFPGFLGVSTLIWTFHIYHGLFCFLWRHSLLDAMPDVVLYFPVEPPLFISFTQFNCTDDQQRKQQIKRLKVKSINDICIIRSVYSE